MLCLLLRSASVCFLLPLPCCACLVRSLGRALARARAALAALAPHGRSLAAPLPVRDSICSGSSAQEASPYFNTESLTRLVFRTALCCSQLRGVCYVGQGRRRGSRSRPCGARCARTARPLARSLTAASVALFAWAAGVCIVALCVTAARRHCVPCAAVLIRGSSTNAAQHNGVRARKRRAARRAARHETHFCMRRRLLPPCGAMGCASSRIDFCV